MSRTPRLNVLYVITEVSGVSFYRVWQPAMALRDMGVKTAFLWYTHNMLTRPSWEWEIEGSEHSAKIRNDLDMGCYWADVVVWMCLHHPHSLNFFREMRLKYPKKPFLLELDDTVYDIPGGNVGSMAYYPGSPLHQVIQAQVDMSDGIVLSTEWLAERMKKHGKPVHVVENTIDLSRWPRPSRPVGRQVNIGWVGGGTHNDDLELVKEAVFKMLRDRRDVKFTILHGCPEFFKHKPDCEWLNTNDPRYSKVRDCPRCGGILGINWTHEFQPIDKYPKWVAKAKFDIGIAPLQDNAFNKAKSNLRWLEYSAMGIPTVSSPLENFTKTIHNGTTGLIASSPEEWATHLTRLVEDVNLRRQIGKAALAEVKAKWTPQLQAKKYLQILRGYVAEPNQKHSRHPN